MTQVESAFSAMRAFTREKGALLQEMMTILHTHDANTALFVYILTRLTRKTAGFADEMVC